MMEQIEGTLDSILQPQLDIRDLTPPTIGQQRLSVVLVLATVIVALLLGWVLKTAVQGNTEAYGDTLVRLDYPATWVVSQEDGSSTVLRNPGSASQVFNAQVSVLHDELPSSGLPGSSPLAEAATVWTLRRSRELDTFRNLSTAEDLTLAGLPAIRIDYAYVADPSAELGRPGVPVVVRGSDVVAVTGGTLTVISGQSWVGEWETFAAQFGRIIASVEPTPAGGQP